VPIRSIGFFNESQKLSGVNKFGRNPDVDTAADEDIWDAGGTWSLPATASAHDIASTDAADAAAGTGARTVQVWGLQNWGTRESSEIVVLDGVTPVATTKSYVLIHRMQCLTFGSGKTNAGDITAKVGATTHAQISIGVAQTLMAIYGIPDDTHLFVSKWYASMNRPGGATSFVDMRLMVDPAPASADSGFSTKHHLGLYSSGASYISHEFNPFLEVAGPAVLKIRALDVSGNDTDISAGFDGYLSSSGWSD
jgi:hypothetical protein